LHAATATSLGAHAVMVVARALCFSLLLCCAWAASAGRPFAEGGMPCVDEVCVGDDALSLMHLPWQRATGPGTDTPLADARVSASYLDDVHSVLRGDEEAIRRIAPYWYLRVLDADGLRALTGIRAVCESPGVDGRLHGVYVDEQGHRTVVSFEPVASFAGARPRFLVAAIVRYFSADDPVHLTDTAACLPMRPRRNRRQPGSPSRRAARTCGCSHRPGILSSAMRTCADMRSAKRTARTSTCRATCREPLALTASADFGQ
jgi:hypothetical protein